MPRHALDRLERGRRNNKALGGQGLYPRMNRLASLIRPATRDAWRVGPQRYGFCVGGVGGAGGGGAISGGGGGGCRSPWACGGGGGGPSGRGWGAQAASTRHAAAMNTDERTRRISTPWMVGRIDPIGGSVYTGSAGFAGLCQAACRLAFRKVPRFHAMGRSPGAPGPGSCRRRA